MLVFPSNYIAYTIEYVSPDFPHNEITRKLHTFQRTHGSIDTCLREVHGLSPCENGFIQVVAFDILSVHLPPTHTLIGALFCVKMRNLSNV